MHSISYQAIFKLREKHVYLRLYLMRKIAVFIILAYAALFTILTWPVILASFYSPNKPESNIPGIHDFISLYAAPPYWIFIVAVLLCQAGLLFIPVKIASRRPISKKSIYMPLIVSGFLVGVLFLGVFCSIAEFFMLKDNGFSGWTGLVCCALIWIIWSFIFCRSASDKAPESIIQRQCRFLLQGSIIALLVAVPMHIAVRRRGECCAGFLTFTGITFGLAVLLLSFGPSVYFLYAARWKKLHPERYAAKADGCDASE